MPNVVLHRGAVERFETVEVDTGALALTIVPELGGKISSLRDRRNGREWLWRHPRMPYRRVPHGATYTAVADTGGWDECFPSVAACAYPSPPWAGTRVQDHGELWSQTAALAIVEEAGGVTLHTRWHGIMLPYTFERAIVLAAGSARVRFEYRVTNTADAPLRFIWSAHPLIAIEPGMRLLLPPEAHFNTWRPGPDGAPEQARGLGFPLTLRAGEREIDLATLPEPTPGAAIKLWSDPLSIPEGWAGIRAADGELRMRWDAALLPQVAVWMNLGAFGFDGGGAYYNLGLEPCMGAQDSLADAVDTHNLFHILPPGETRSWWLEVDVLAA